MPLVVKAKPELAKVEPFKTVLSGDDLAAIARLPFHDLEGILAATLTGMPDETFASEARAWIADAKDRRWKRLYTTYLPKGEALKYLRGNGHKTYIVAGTGRISCGSIQIRFAAFPLSR
jgi:hypothetical protein